MPKAQETPYKDLIDLPERFVDQLRLVNWDGYRFFVEFATKRPYSSGPNQSQDVLIPAARLVLTPHLVVQLRDVLSQVVADLERKGVLTRLAPENVTKQ